MDADKIREAGGPAFPTLHIPDCSPPAWSGMTLRDYFAIHAPDNLAAIMVQANREELAGRNQPPDWERTVDGATFNCQVEAALRYIFADAMLAERAK